MGQKTNPIGNRLGYIRGWESNWFGGNDFGDKLAEDEKIRKYINIRLARASVSRIPIERTMKMITEKGNGRPWSDERFALPPSRSFIAMTLRVVIARA